MVKNEKRETFSHGAGGDCLGKLALLSTLLRPVDVTDLVTLFEGDVLPKDILGWKPEFFIPQIGLAVAFGHVRTQTPSHRNPPDPTPPHPIPPCPIPSQPIPPHPTPSHPIPPHPTPSHPPHPITPNPTPTHAHTNSVGSCRVGRVVSSLLLTTIHYLDRCTAQLATRSRRRQRATWHTSGRSLTCLRMCFSRRLPLQTTTATPWANPSRSWCRIWTTRMVHLTSSTASCLASTFSTTTAMPALATRSLGTVQPLRGT